MSPLSQHRWRVLVLDYKCRGRKKVSVVGPGSPNSVLVVGHSCMFIGKSGWKVRCKPVQHRVCGRQSFRPIPQTTTSARVRAGPWGWRCSMSSFVLLDMIVLVMETKSLLKRFAPRASPYLVHDSSAFWFLRFVFFRSRGRGSFYAAQHCGRSKFARLLVTWSATIH